METQFGDNPTISVFYFYNFSIIEKFRGKGRWFKATQNQNKITEPTSDFIYKVKVQRPKMVY